MFLGIIDSRNRKDLQIFGQTKAESMELRLLSHIWKFNLGSQVTLTLLKFYLPSIPYPVNARLFHWKTYMYGGSHISPQLSLWSFLRKKKKRGGGGKERWYDAFSSSELLDWKPALVTKIRQLLPSYSLVDIYPKCTILIKYSISWSLCLWAGIASMLQVRVEIQCRCGKYCMIFCCTVPSFKDSQTQLQKSQRFPNIGLVARKPLLSIIGQVT